MSQKKTKPKNRPTLSTPLIGHTPSSSLHLTSFHPSKPLYAVATTAIGQNVIRIFDTNRPVPGAQEVRCEVRLKRGEEVSCLSWAVYDGKKRKRVQSSAGELVCGVMSGRIYVIEQASGEIVKTLEGHTAGVNSWSVDEDKGWSCGGDGKLKAWDFRTGNCLLTVSPEVEGLEFTSLAVAPGKFFLSSSQTLFLLSNPAGDIMSQITAHTTPIHTVHYSPELEIVTTAAVGDRFITVVSTEGDQLTRLGSLTCTHDVRAFRLQNETLLVITVIGTLEIFQSFHTNFEPGKKGGLTKPPNAEIHLTTSHAAKVEIQDVVARGKEMMISWIEGAKTGFELINIYSMSGKVEINVETRREQSQQQTSKPYDESTAVVFTSTDVPTTQVNGTTPQTTDLSFADRLSQLQPQTTSAPVVTTAVMPNASSLSTVLTQALNSSDEKLLNTCFQQSHNHETIHNTLVRLSPALVPTLLSYFNSVLSRKQKRAQGMFEWIREVVVIHGGYLVSQGREVKEVLVRLKGTLDRRGQSWERLARLKGRLELLRTVKGRENIVGKEPEVRWVEEIDGEEGEEPEIEDVRYLIGDVDDEDEMGESDDEIEEVGGEMDDDVEMENGVDSEDDTGEDDDESSDEPVQTIKKVNGVPHFSDSENSAVDLEDLIDDEAEEASDDESEEEEEDIAPPPPKKSKSRR